MYVSYYFHTFSIVTFFVSFCRNLSINLYSSTLLTFRINFDKIESKFIKEVTKL